MSGGSRTGITVEARNRGLKKKRRNIDSNRNRNCRLCKHEDHRSYSATQQTLLALISIWITMTTTTNVTTDAITSTTNTKVATDAITNNITTTTYVTTDNVATLTDNTDTTADW